MLADAAELAGDAAYLRARAARDNEPELLRTAALLTAGARQSERDAWHMASLEAASREASQGSALDRERREFQRRLAERQLQPKKDGAE